MKGRRLVNADRRAWLVLPALLLLGVAFLGPVGWLLARAFSFPEPGLQNFEVLWERPVYLKVMGNTLLISAVVTPVVMLLGFPGGAPDGAWLGAPAALADLPGVGAVLDQPAGARLCDGRSCCSGMAW